MAMTPIDLRMTQAMNEVTQIRHNELTKPEVQQHNISQNIEKQVDSNSHVVISKDGSNKPDTHHDAREKGRNEYFKREEEKKKKKMEGTVSVKSSSFSASI